MDEEYRRKKISFGSILIFIILLLIFGVIISYFFTDESPLGKCNTIEDCSKYSVFYIKGNGYVCANNQLAVDDSLKTKAMMFKYASKNNVKYEPDYCMCVENICKPH